MAAAIVALLVGFGAQGASPTEIGPIPLALAAQVFREAREICERDGGRLWGRDLHAPILLVAASRQAVANRAGADGRLVEKEGVWVGRLPAGEIVANSTGVSFGTRWTTFVWPLPEDREDRAALLLHELFHFAQEDLGFPMKNAVCGHLDTLEGRFWLQCEWRALRAALLGKGDARREAIADAILFRARRRAAFPEGAALERDLETNEGLAEYTGVKLRGAPEAETLRHLADRLERKAETLPAFARSFAYQTGPAYGLLLDAIDPGWRRALRAGDDLAERLGKAAGIEPLGDPVAEAEKRAEAYGGPALRAAEEERDRARRERLADFRRRLVEGPRFEFPLGPDFSYGFDPNEVLALDEIGTVLPAGEVTDAWGSVRVETGGLLASDFGRFWTPGPIEREGSTLRGDGWTFRIPSGWTVVSGARTGDQTLARER